MRSGTRVEPALVRGLPLRPAGHQGGCQRPLRRYIQAAFGCPFGVLLVDRAGRLPALPSDGERPRVYVAHAPLGGQFGRLQRADQVVTVGAMKVTHVTNHTSPESLFGEASTELVTCRNPRQIRPVTSVTQLSSHSLRARTRRPSKKSSVTNVISMLTSDVKTRNYNYQLHCGHTHPWSESTKVLSLLSLKAQS